MPRVARQKSSTGIYHIILRGINKQTIFEDLEDREKFLQTLGAVKEKSGCKIYAYCLMENHIHLLLKEEKEELGTIMRRLGASYVYWYNWKYDRNGHLFQDRYKSEAVEDDTYLLTVLRYIHQNPLQAGLIKDISQYKWSSYLECIGKNRLINRKFALGLFDEDPKKALKKFKEFHEKISNHNCMDIDKNRRIKDEEAKEMIKSICNTSHSTELQKIENKEERDHYLRILKEEGLSTRQIARLTGISRGIILKA